MRKEVFNQNILNSTEVISEMVNNVKVKIIGAMYDVSSGDVNFFEYLMF